MGAESFDPAEEPKFAWPDEASNASGLPCESLASFLQLGVTVMLVS